MGSDKKKTTAHSETQNRLPAYMREGSERAVGMAVDRTNQAYEGYDGQRIAEMSDNERMGSTMARDTSTLDGMTSFTDEGVAEKYMNPYMDQVVTPGLRRKNEAFESERARRKQNRRIDPRNAEINVA
jgi:hypothetical protein